MTLSPVGALPAAGSTASENGSSRIDAGGSRRSPISTPKAGGSCRRPPPIEPLMRAAAWYFMHARNKNGLPLDAVARFHPRQLGRGWSSSAGSATAPRRASRNRSA